MIANETMMVKGFEICIDDMEPGDMEILMGWSETLLRNLAVRELVVNRKTYRVVPGFFSIVKAEIDSIGTATRAREAGRSARIGRKLRNFIQEQLGCDYDTAREVIRQVQATR
jgi:hypothetical protein